MKKITYLGKILAAGALSLLGACAHDPIDQAPVAGDGAKELILSITVPGASQQTSTRAITANEENTIQTVDVLVFKINGASETYDYWTTGTLTTPTGTERQTFTAKLQVKPNQRFVVITNAHQQVADLIGRSTWQGAAKADMLARLKLNLTGSQDRWNATSAADYTRMPMWGESDPETVTATTTHLASTIYLMRMVARVDVKLDTSVTGLTSQFKLKSVGLYNTNTGGQMAPDAAKVVTEQRNGTPYKYVNATTVPTELQPYSARHPGPINYTDFTAPGVTDVSMIGAIYTFEANATSTDSEATYLVIGGLYGTDTSPSYYRVDFYKAGTKTRLDILRNHHYTINIVSVKARGHATPDEAASSTAVNMNANILVWNQPSMDNVAINGQNTLRTNKDRLTLFSNAYTNASPTGDNTFTVSTDYPSGWTIDTSSLPSWLTLAPVAGAANQTATVVVSASQNTGGTSRTATINVKAGNMTLPVTITQTTQPAISLMIYDSNNVETQEIVFAGGAGVSVTRTFRVDWLPATNPVAVVANQAAQYEFPNPGGNPAVQDGAPYTNMPWPETTGTKSFSVTPPALTAAELAANPFISKASRFDMTAFNGYTTVTKSITLRQLNYTLLVEDPIRSFSYPMGRSAAASGSNPGAVYNYNVRSNSNWTISNVVEYPRTTASGMTPLIAAHTGSDNVYTGAAGLANTTPGGGYREQLTTNPNGRGNSGYADVTYTSNPTGRFANVTQRLFFPSAPFTVYGIVKFSDPNVNFYNIFAGSTNKTPGTSTRSQHIHPMLNANNNYGSNLNGTGNTATPSSTVFTVPLVVNGVNYNDSSQLTATDITDAVTAGADMLFISGSTTFGDATAKAIFDNFLAKDKPVLLAVEDANTMSALWYYVGSGRLVWTSQALNGNAPVYQFKQIDGDPIMEGPFGWLRNLYWGCDGTGSIAYAPDDMSQLVSYSNAQNRSGSTDSAVGNENNGWTTCFRLTKYPLVFVADGGFAGCFDTSDSRAPALINTNGNTPTYKANYGGGSTKQSVYNSYFIANVIAWAIQRRTNQ